MPATRFTKPEENRAYYAFLNDMLNHLGQFDTWKNQVNQRRAESGQPAVNDLRISDDEFESAEKFIEDALSKGLILPDKETYIALGSDCFKLYKAITAEDNASQADSHLHVYKNGQYHSLSVGADGRTADDGQTIFTEAASVYPYVKSRIIELTNDLLSAQHFWTDSSPELGEFSKAMRDLGRNFRFLTPINKNNKLGHLYGLKDMVDELSPAFRAMEQYLDNTDRNEELDPRQVTVRKAMNSFKIIYETVKAAAERQPDPRREPFSAVDLRNAEQRNADPLVFREKTVTLTADEEKVLNLLYPENNISVTEKNRLLWTAVNTGKLRVIDEYGDFAKPEDALRVLTFNTRHKHGVHHYQLSNDGKTYESKVIKKVPDQGANGNTFTITQARENAPSSDKILIIKDVENELFRLGGDLWAARSYFGPSEKRQALGNGIHDAYEKLHFNQVSYEDDFKEFLHDAAESALAYIEDKKGNSLDAKQIDRLCVAHKIVALDSLLKQPDLTYGDYLKNMYAEKIFLDGVADIHSRSKSLVDITANEAEKAMAKELTTVESPELFKETMAAKRQAIMNSEEFWNCTTELGTELSAGDLKKMLHEEREVTCKKLNTEVNILHQHWKEVQREAGVGPYGWVGKYGTGQEPQRPAPKKTDKEAYCDFLTDMLKVLGRYDEWNAAPVIPQEPQRNDASSMVLPGKYKRAEKMVEEAFGKGLILDDNGRAIAGNAKCSAVFQKIRPVKSDANESSHLHIYKNGSFNSVDVKHDGTATLNGQSKFTEATIVCPYLKTRVNELTADLLSTQHFWVNSSPEYNKASEALVDLSKKLEDPEFAKKSFSDLEKEFLPTVRAMEQYQESKRETANLSSRQVTRLKIMSKFQAIYEAVKEAAADRPRPRPEPLSDLAFRGAELKNKAALVNLEKMGPEYVKAGLTNRQLLGEVRSSVPVELPNTKKSPVFKYTSKEIAAHFLYGDQENRKLNLKNKYFISPSGKAVTQREPFTAEEEKILNSLNLTGADINQKYENFLEIAKKGKIMVFNGNKPAAPEEALRVLASNIRRADGKAHFYQRKDIKTYEGKTLELPAGAEPNRNYEIKPAGNLPIQTDQLLIYTEAIKQTSQLIKDLAHADSMLPPGELHREMSDKLKDIFKRFDQYDMENGSVEAFKRDFYDLASAARHYIGNKKGKSLDDNTVDRLCVAHKIVAISDLIWQPNLSYELFLKNMYAEKVYLDGLANGHSKIKYSLDANMKAVDKKLMAELTDTGKLDTQPGWTWDHKPATYSIGTGRNARAEKRIQVMQTREFNQHIAGMGVAGLKELLKEKREVTCEALKTTENLRNMYWSEIQQAAGVGPGAYSAQPQNNAARNGNAANNAANNHAHI
ncbi:MAG: hypothetical protein KBS74_01560 [Clostridiales bacterium]|nr:hypothetical protein [Candidatus Cacconaster stercorequi]